MPRARNVKPSLFKNELLGEADPMITILFVGLWCLADKEGRLEDRPKRIRAEIFPYREGIDINGMLDWLDSESFINRYRIEDESYIQIAKFHIHQSPHHMENESVIPPMDGDTNKFKAKPIYKKQRERIMERDGGACVQCGSTKKLHIDHIVPVSLGGTSDDENLQVLCQKCNTSKGNRSSTNRQRIVKNDSSPTDSLNLIPDSSNTDSSNTERGRARPQNSDDVLMFMMEITEPKTARSEAERFFDYYTANGWKVGKNPMKDWQATARNWIRRRDDENNKPTFGGRESKSERSDRAARDYLASLGEDDGGGMAWVEGDGSGTH